MLVIPRATFRLSTHMGLPKPGSLSIRRRKSSGAGYLVWGVRDRSRGEAEEGSRMKIGKGAGNQMLKHLLR